MSGPQIQLQTKPALISLKTTNVKQSISQPKADQSIQQPMAKHSIRQVPPKLSIDQTVAWQNLGFKSSAVRSRESAAYSNQKWNEHLGSIAQDGDEMMRIEDGGNPIVSQAQQAGIWTVEVKPGNAPAHEQVKIQYQPGHAEIQNEAQKPVIKNVARKAELGFERGGVAVSTKQYADVTIDFKDLTFKGYQFETTI
ncbi:hypothetical protein N781_01875 [Pontibacillus halophilus JSM 076056 = DSM 19796]|uniref:Uncharacterized protein n=1 Tax=Pontibacillus halophilus JSM 076056 = DSM 19796 TaxID=1385510 RepID=A0A0A5GL12_9BACI|nr:DUF6470 family protein [Pontibacillus halophilus]KGX93951.1 hypothetical protein N781_01875 [Pontibacillus halophilus JSM 076056 = DSM 19796]